MAIQLGTTVWFEPAGDARVVELQSPQVEDQPAAPAHEGES